MPPYCDLHQNHYEMAYINGLPWKECVCLKCHFEKVTGTKLSNAVNGDNSATYFILRG